MLLLTFVLHTDFDFRVVQQQANHAPAAILSTIVSRLAAPAFLALDMSFEGGGLEAEDAEVVEDGRRDFGSVSSSVAS